MARSAVPASPSAATANMPGSSGSTSKSIDRTKPHERQGRDEAEPDARGGHASRPDRSDETDDVGAAGAERDAHADLVRALRDEIRHERIQTEHREDDRERRERGDQRGVEPRDRSRHRRPSPTSGFKSTSGCEGSTA